MDMTDPNTNCPSGWQLTGYSKKTCGRAQGLVTQSCSLSVEDHTVRCVVGSKLTNMDCLMPSMGIMLVDKLQLTVPMSVVWL